MGVVAIVILGIVTLVFCMLSIALFLSEDLQMPGGKKKSRVVKQKREEGHTAFAKLHTARSPSPNKSDYCPSISDNDGNDSVTDIDSGNDRQRDNQAEISVVALQCLHTVFLPPYLQPDQSTWKKCQKINNRPAIYTKSSWMMAWRRDVTQRNTVQGCGTLDRFILRMVGNPNEPQSEASHCPQK